MWRAGIARADPISVWGRVKRQRTRRNGLGVLAGVAVLSVLIKGGLSFIFRFISAFNNGVPVDWMSVSVSILILISISISTGVTDGVDVVDVVASDAAGGGNWSVVKGGVVIIKPTHCCRLPP